MCRHKSSTLRAMTDDGCARGADVVPPSCRRQRGQVGGYKTIPKTHPRPTQAQRDQHSGAQYEGGGWVKSYLAAMPPIGGHRSFQQFHLQSMRVGPVSID